jgi:hypothetical protein
LPFLGSSAGGSKDFSYHPLGFTDPHVEDFGARDAQEALLHFATESLAVLLGEVVGGSLPKKSLSAARRSVKENPLDRLLAVRLKNFGIEQGLLDGLADESNRLFLPADLLPANLGDFFYEVVLVIRFL